MEPMLQGRSHRKCAIVPVALAVVVSVLLASISLATPTQASDRPAKGMFLVAGPDLQDPNFAHSVVLLIDYGEHGAAGLIINRRTEARLVDLLPELEGGDQVAGEVFLGGPVSPGGLLVLMRAEAASETARPVFDDVYVSASREMLERLAGGEETFRVYVGHAGWAPGQLDWEIRHGGWSLLRADAETVFDQEPEDVWRKMLRRATSPLAANPSTIEHAPERVRVDPRPPEAMPTEAVWESAAPR